VTPRGLALLRSRRTALLFVFLAAEVFVLLSLLAQQAWPRAVPAALGWTIFLGTYPWSLAWLAVGSEDPGITMAVLAACFGLNATLLAALGWLLVRGRRVE
jgi:hypothetical protein